MSTKPKKNQKKFRNSSTAHVHWNEQWISEEGRKGWIIPEDDVQEAVSLMKIWDVNDVLDMGCGVGRHSVFFSQYGFRVFSTDMSFNGIHYARKRVYEKKVHIHFNISTMESLPFKDASFDYVLAWNVIYHGNTDTMKATLHQINRTLRPNGLFQGTALDKRNGLFQIGVEVAQDTWVIEDGDEKAHPHCYVNAKDLIDMLSQAGFEVLFMRSVVHDTQRSFHWHFLVQKVTTSSVSRI